MGTDFNIKPVGAPAVTPYVAPVSQAADDAVSTELPPRQSVSAADVSDRARNGPQTSAEQLSHQGFLDRAANTFVYQVVDNRTSQVVRQFPDEAILRRRAYFHTLDLLSEERARPIATDRKA